MKGAPDSITVEKIAASASASRNAWKTRSSARSRRPAPSARATADETPVPMPLLVVCSTSITQGNASEAPASASVPMRPRKKSVECDHAREREQVEDVRGCQAQQRGQDRTFEQKLGTRYRGRCNAFGGCQRWRGNRDVSVVHRQLLPLGARRLNALSGPSQGLADLSAAG